MVRRPSRQKLTVESPDGDEIPNAGDTEDQKLIREAKKRFKLCSDWYSVWRARCIEDIKFVNADARNMYQWPLSLRNARGYGSEDERPCLTINKTRQHCLQIINDGRQNKTSIKIKPVGDGSTYESAQVLEGIVRHIEYISNAQSLYTLARRYQVWGGIGYVRVVTRYVDETSFDQDIFFEGVEDPTAVYLDVDYKEPDGSDMRYAFVFADVPRDEFENRYPDMKLRPTTSVLGNNEGDWVGKDKVRIAEYYYRTEKRDELIVFTDPETGEPRPLHRSELAGMSGALREAYNQQLEDPNTRRRDIIRDEVKWVKIAGEEIVDRKDWSGKTIPIAFAIGEKTIIDGEMDMKGHTRALIDPQNMFNYNASASVEYGALQSKSPYLAPVAAIEELQDFWERQNLDNLSVLPYNHMGDDGQAIPPPSRQQPPMGAPVFQQGMQNAANDMMLVSGQYQPMMGEPSNERSGKAIQARQRQGENATYHFIDNEATMIRRLGKIVLEVQSSIYDTPRLLQIIGDDGKPSDIYLDPDAKQAYDKRVAQDKEAAEQIVFNPSVGRYDVMSDVGPDYATRRQEAFNALSQIAAQNPELMAVIGDLVMLAADFPLADEAAERLRRMVPKQAMDDNAPDPQTMALQKELTSAQALVAAMSEKLSELKAKANQGDEQKGVNIFKAVTDRLDVLMKYGNIPATELVRFTHDLAMQEHAAQMDLVKADQANSNALELNGASTDASAVSA